MDLFYLEELSRYEKWLKYHTPRGELVDYTYKAQILKDRLNRDISKIGFHQFRNSLDEIYDCTTPNTFSNQTLQSWLDELFEKFGACAIRESMRINNAYYHKLSRLKKRVGSIISYRSFFLTLTFTNDVLNRTSEKTRREYVTRYLKSLSSNYVGNIDFGKKNHREHYHAIVQCEHIEHSAWIYGNLDFELVRVDEESSSELLSKYITKLSFHAIKETNKRKCLVYPKIRK